MQQYNTIKAKYPDALLLFRVGDFYETFGEDAIKAASILNITLTARNNGGDQTELAGFPHHSLNTYLPKLVMAGCRVAICDQLEDPKQTKTIVKRGVTELVTPGVALNDDILSSKSNNFLAAVHLEPTKNKIEVSHTILGISFLDISTGEYLLAQGNIAHIDKLLQNFNPSEILINKQNRTFFQKYFGATYHTFYLEDWVYKPQYANDSLQKHFSVNSLKGFGVQELHLGIIAAGAILHYLNDTQHKQLKHITRLSRIEEDQYVWLDKFTIRNLELYQTNHKQGVNLLEVIDKTVSPMGGRLLRRWLALPLKNKEAIQKRHHIVETLINNQKILNHTQLQLKKMGDLERLVSKLATGKINPREVNFLKITLQAVQHLKKETKLQADSPIFHLVNQLQDCENIVTRIKKTLNEEASIAIGKGKTIKNGVNKSLDEYRALAFGGKEYLNKMLEREQQATGITSLKIASNNVFGYYIEVRNTHKDKVPSSWVRKQTLVSAERYITEELKEYEQKIIGAEEQILNLEQNIFQELIESIIPNITLLQQNANLVAQIDCLCAFAMQAIEANYCKPELTDGLQLKIEEGRHPVIEKQLPPDNPFIANNLYLDPETQQIIMITGPNMSGKSAILRQTALIVLLAQIGSYVPAKAVKMGCVDKIFTRVGASDNLSMGESTFMVEMNETASILNNLSPRSLILLDEIGRGTSTYDGISIAWAITQYLHEHPTKPKTLFATHYHELNDMSHTYPRIKNYNVAVKELKDTVLFLRKLQPGGSHHSFGIHVAKMAGMPKEVVQKAQKMLAQLEQKTKTNTISKQLHDHSREEMQLSFFKLDDPLLEEIRDQILETDIDTLTPVEALMKLNEIKRTLQRSASLKLKK